MTLQPKPFYESQQDRDNQAEVAAELQRCWNLTATRRLGYNQVLDYLLEEQGRPWAFCEVKVRPTLAFGGGHRDGYLLSLTKVFRAEQIAEIFGMPTFLAVRFADRSIWTAPFAKLRRDRLVWFGRGSFVAKQEQDHEPGAVMPWDAFTVLEA